MNKFEFQASYLDPAIVINTVQNQGLGYEGICLSTRNRQWIKSDKSYFRIDFYKN